MSNNAPPFIPDYVTAKMIKIYLADHLTDPHTGMRKAAEYFSQEMARLVKPKQVPFTVTEELIVDCYAYIWATTPDLYKLTPKEIAADTLRWVEEYLAGKIDPKKVIKDKRIELLQEVFNSRNIGTYTGEIENILSMMDRANAK